MLNTIDREKMFTRIRRLPIFKKEIPLNVNDPEISHLLRVIDMLYSLDDWKYICPLEAGQIISDYEMPKIVNYRGPIQMTN